MRALSRFYALEDENNHLKLTYRETGKALYATSYSVEEKCLWLSADLPNLVEEARRLILQWIFDEKNLRKVVLSGSTLGSGPDVLQAWSDNGARLDSDGLSVTALEFKAANQAQGCKGQAWLELDLPLVQVACVALINDQNQVLLAQRPKDKALANLWEFPGGKLEAGESPELALCREMHEELGIDIWNSCLAPLTFVSHAYESFRIALLAFACYRWEGEPKGLEGQAFAWFDLRDMDPSIMPPANAPLVHVLRDLLG